MMAMTDFKGVLFDLDGTLVDNYSAIHITTCEAFKKFGIPEPSREKIVKTVGGSILITMQRLLTGTEFEKLYTEVADYYMGIFQAYVFYDLRMMPYAEEVLKAYTVRPGLTGPAQVYDRNSELSWKVCLNVI